MKVNEQEKLELSDAIDKINEGLETFIELYNESSDDQPLINFEEHVIEKIEKAKSTFGDEFVDEKINTIIKGVFDLLPLNDVPDNEEASPS